MLSDFDMFAPMPVYCGICGDTGFVWGTPEYGKCDCMEEIEEEKETTELVELREFDHVG